ncbi:hypothetical protein [Streptomyces sp. NPDC047869]|uniref:hypothetical protein n=1 Tax=Streptomyces sp. NPDC047869 TaxID=3154709 RepID=UPI00345197F2
MKAAPVPAPPDTDVVHDAAAPSAAEGPAGLPKRRRGRTLAAAERSRPAPRADGPRVPSGTEQGAPGGRRRLRLGV